MKKINDVELVELDFVKDRDVAIQYSVMFLPTVIIFDNGKVQSVIEGLQKEKKYYDKIRV